MFSFILKYLTYTNPMSTQSLLGYFFTLAFLCTILLSLKFLLQVFFLAIAYPPTPPPITKIKWAVPNCSHCRLLVARNVTLKGKKKVRKKLNQAPFCNPRKAFWSYTVADPGEGLPPPPAPPVIRIKQIAETCNQVQGNSKIYTPSQPSEFAAEFQGFASPIHLKVYSHLHHNWSLCRGWQHVRIKSSSAEAKAEVGKVWLYFL